MTVGRGNEDRGWRGEERQGHMRQGRESRPRGHVTLTMNNKTNITPLLIGKLHKFSQLDGGKDISFRRRGFYKGGERRRKTHRLGPHHSRPTHAPENSKKNSASDTIISTKAYMQNR